MASMHGHVNEWHGIKIKKQKDKPQSKHVKEKQACEQSKQKLMEHNTYEKKLKENKHVNTEAINK